MRASGAACEKSEKGALCQRRLRVTLRVQVSTRMTDLPAIDAPIVGKGLFCGVLACADRGLLDN